MDHCRIPLTDVDVQRIAETTAARIACLLKRRGLLDQESVDSLWQAEPLLASLTATSVQCAVATGERAGQRIRRGRPKGRYPGLIPLLFLSWVLPAR